MGTEQLPGLRALFSDSDNRPAPPPHRSAAAATRPKERVSPHERCPLAAALTSVATAAGCLATSRQLPLFTLIPYEARSSSSTASRTSFRLCSAIPAPAASPTSRPQLPPLRPRSAPSAPPAPPVTAQLKYSALPRLTL